MHKQNVKIFTAGNLPNQGIKVGRTTTEVFFSLQNKSNGDQGVSEDSPLACKDQFLYQLCTRLNIMANI